MNDLFTYISLNIEERVK